MKKPELEKLLGKKVGGPQGARGGGQTALNRREQALARKRELIEKLRKTG
jgi:hypothetical protein